MQDDSELLRAYADSGSEAAFTELVRRRLGLVYAAAFRRTGDAQRAQDVAQIVFTEVARRAGALAQLPFLTGWLYRRAHFAASDILRAERRRAVREQEAHTMQQIAADGEPAPEWEKVRPVLDEALNEMDERDRDAILLRFFDGQSFAVVGTRLRLSENAARMRVERALEKLRLRLGRRGVTSTTAALAAVLGHPALAASPAGLAGTIAGAALSGAAATAAGSAIAFPLFMKKSTVVAAGLLALLSLGVAVFQIRETSRVEEDLAALTREHEALAARLRTAEELGSREKQRASVAEQRTRDVVARAPIEARAVNAPTPIEAARKAGAEPRSVIGTVLPDDSADLEQKVRAQRNAQLDAQHEALYRLLGFDPAQRERFKGLLIDYQEIRERTIGAAQQAVAAQSGGKPTPRALEEATVAAEAQTNAEFTALVRDAFGPAVAQALGRFNETAPQRVMAEQLASELFYSAAPLSPEQAEQMVEIFAQNSRRTGRERFQFTDENRAEVYRLAQQVLGPAQLPALQRLQQQAAWNASRGSTVYVERARK